MGHKKDQIGELNSFWLLNTLGFASDNFLLHMLGWPKHLLCNTKDIQYDTLPLKIPDIGHTPRKYLKF